MTSVSPFLKMFGLSFRSFPSALRAARHARAVGRPAAATKIISSWGSCSTESIAGVAKGKGQQRTCDPLITNGPVSYKCIGQYTVVVFSSFFNNYIIILTITCYCCLSFCTSFGWIGRDTGYTAGLGSDFILLQAGQLLRQLISARPKVHPRHGQTHLDRTI